jgi:hypothetical protein
MCLKATLREIQMNFQEPVPIKADERFKNECIRYSICTIVTRPAEYAAMIESFRLNSFQEPDCEFLYLDNSQGNAFEAYAGYNLFLNVARGTYAILCHQDILLMRDGRAKLDSIIESLTKRDPNWAACGNAGSKSPGQLALRISDPHGEDQSTDHFPIQVQSLDENFIVVRRSANLALSHNLSGFHFYGADICIIADILGWNCYVIDFHLRHNSPGTKDESFFSIRDRLIQKYRKALRSRWVGTTSSVFFITGNLFLLRLLNKQFATKIIRFAVRNLFSPRRLKK